MAGWLAPIAKSSGRRPAKAIPTIRRSVATDEADIYLTGAVAWV
jgi:hypothetical protein